MEQNLKQASEEVEKTLQFLELVSVRSEGYLKGDDWVRSTLADLKIDRWLATEHGEENSPQVTRIDALVATYEKVLRKSVFDPDPADLRGGLAIEAAAANLGRYVVQIARMRAVSHQAILMTAQELLDGTESRIMAFECMDRLSSYCGIVIEDINEVILRTKHLLSCC